MAIQRKHKNQAIIPVSAMSDIAFLLLIFFMLSSFAEVDKEIPLKLPQSEISRQEKKKYFNVWVQKNGDIFYDNSQGTLSGLKTYANRRLFKNPDVKALIRASRFVEYKTVNSVLKSLKGAGIHNVVFVSKKKENGE